MASLRSVHKKSLYDLIKLTGWEGGIEFEREKRGLVKRGRKQVIYFLGGGVFSFCLVKEGRGGGEGGFTGSFSFLVFLL